jgi:CheY-like chemotaxis protein
MNSVHHLMLVDDDEDDREIFLSVVKSILPGANYTIASNGEDALQKLNLNHLVPHLIFLDLNMPLMNGKQFLMEIKKHENLNSIPVVILSTSSDQNTIKDAMDLGARDFVTKPERYSGWEQAIKSVLNNFGIPE